MERAVLLQAQATDRKLGILRRFSDEALRQADWMLSQRTDRSPKRLRDKTYRQVKESSGFQAQMMCDLSRRGVPVNGFIHNSGSDAPGSVAVPMPVRGKGKPTASVGS